MNKSLVSIKACHHLIIRILGDLTASKVRGYLVDISTHQCFFHCSKRFTHFRQTLQEVDGVKLTDKSNRLKSNPWHMMHRHEGGRLLTFSEPPTASFNRLKPTTWNRGKADMWFKRKWTSVDTLVVWRDVGTTEEPKVKSWLWRNFCGVLTSEGKNWTWSQLLLWWWKTHSAHKSQRWKHKEINNN